MKDMDKDYTFDGLKYTFDQYRLCKSDNGQTMAFDIFNPNIKYGGVILDRLLFACAWVQSTIIRTHSRHESSIKTIDELDYEYAFNDDARKVYDVIMNNIKSHLTIGNTIYPKRIIEEFDKANLNFFDDPNYIEYGKQIVKNLLLDKERFKKAEKWISEAKKQDLLNNFKPKR